MKLYILRANEKKYPKCELAFQNTSTENKQKRDVSTSSLQKTVNLAI